MYKNVKFDKGLFTAIDEMGRKIHIQEHISFIYTTNVMEETGVVIHKPVTYKEHKVLGEIEKYLKGKRCNKEVIGSVTIRYGWLDKRLEKTEFINIEDFVKRFRDKSCTSTDKSKLMAVCKQLSISKKDVM